jgi:hypothetical protein
MYVAAVAKMVRASGPAVPLLAEDCPVELLVAVTVEPDEPVVEALVVEPEGSVVELDVGAVAPLEPAVEDVEVEAELVPDVDEAPVASLPCQPGCSSMEHPPACERATTSIAVPNELRPTASRISPASSASGQCRSQPPQGRHR